MAKKDPLGENPLAESVLRGMIRGDKVKKGARPKGKSAPKTSKPVSNDYRRRRRTA